MSNPGVQDSAVILIGFQNDYFSSDGILRGVIEESAVANNVLNHTLKFIKTVIDSGLPIVHTPIRFTTEYRELDNPVGILAAIKESKAFQAGMPGAETINEIKAFGDRIVEIPGKRGLNAFSNTELDLFLRNREVRNIILAGAVTSVCIDSTGRAAFEKGYDVFVLEDCTCGRTNFEQKFYCDEVFPIYAQVISSGVLSEQLLSSAA
ncbi:Nicotinamidase-related amidase [Mariprofundus aestuarium]|uniref:Nicotinamidase-related amidase n=1 Tax=Mariprofundus aestuarium TaxID=1921086 RepID=A0A2K8KX95_MARES|nr:cysteine hydrolase [Mariprofundus aestuarium]ATX79528.1 Nicotinamidase-related amidase [Mariprofundus aestuarium]